MKLARPITYEFASSKLYVQDDKLYWADRPATAFAKPATFTSWNKYYAGRPVEGARTVGGYVTVGIEGKRYMYHRLMYCVYHKCDVPSDMEIDHRDHIRYNNEPHNLRLGTHKANSRNMSLYRNNKTGTHGVRFLKGRYVAVFNRVSLGSFRNLSDAVAVVENARRLHGGYDDNHGK